MNVRKLLVIGLGSTGTEICNDLADRLIEEYGTLDRVPWVRFLCVETDSGAGGTLAERGDLLTMAITSAEYEANLKDPSVLDKMIDWIAWRDAATLERVKSVESGAGNIRMVGRLAFLFPRNFERFQQAFQNRYQSLRDLTERAAAEKHGITADGAGAEIVFEGNQLADGVEDGENGQITIAVVGTLCGGTASGIAVDVGYFLSSYAPGVKRLAYFTLPRGDLDRGEYDDAPKFKKNAYAALREIHHYAQGGNEYHAKFPVKDTPEVGRAHPYELVMLAWPDFGKRDAQRRLQAAIAERLFVASFSGKTDPFVRGVDAIPDYETVDGVKRQSIFCVFGLSVLEYPGPRLLEYCTDRLLARSLRPWLGNTASDSALKAECATVGLTFDGLKSALFSNDQGVSRSLDNLVNNIARNAQKSPATFESGFAQLQAGFGDTTGVAPADGLPQNAVGTMLLQAQKPAVDRVWEGFISHITNQLSDPDKGPGYALDFARTAQARLGEIRDSLPKVLGNQAPQPDQYIAVLERLHQDGYVRRLFLYGKAAADAAAYLKSDLDNWVRDRKDKSVAVALSSSRGGGRSVNGVLDSLDERLNWLINRLNNVSIAVSAYVSYLDGKSEQLRTPPPVNGVCLMKEGTAASAYQTTLAPMGDDAALDKAERNHYVDVVACFRNLGADIGTFGADSPWDTPVSAAAGPDALPARYRRDLAATARQNFPGISTRNAVAQWAKEDNRDALLQDFIRSSKLFIEPNYDLAANCRKTALKRHNVLVYPEGVAGGDASTQTLARSVRNAVPELDEKTSEDRIRAILVREVYCVPPEALPGVVATANVSEALENAEFSVYFPFSRKDVLWEPMSRKEVDRLQKCEELLALAVVLGKARVKGGNLEVDYPPRNPADSTVRRFPADFAQATRKWAVVGMDDSGDTLENLEGQITSAIANAETQLEGSAFVDALFAGARKAPTALAGWDTKRISDVFQRFCLRDSFLKSYYQREFGPDKEALEVLRYTAGQTLVNGEPAPRDGFYCINCTSKCASLLGEDENAAASAHWTCGVCNSKYDRRENSFNAAWPALAQRMKAGGRVDVA